VRHHKAYVEAVNAERFDDSSNRFLNHLLISPLLSSVSRAELKRNEALMKRNAGKDLVGAAQILIDEAARCGRTPLCAELYFNAGEIFHRLDALDEAEAAYRKALGIDSSHKDAIFNFEALFRLVGVRRGQGEAGAGGRQVPEAGEERREGDSAGRGGGPEGGI
jgi:tetratricopeptide (TPR) repeat protein